MKRFRPPKELPEQIAINEEVAWMIGVWIGDNFSPRKGTVMRNGITSSGRFGIVNNDKELIHRFRVGLKREFRIERVKIDIQIPREGRFNREKLISSSSREFGLIRKDINLYCGSPWRKNIGYAVYTNNTMLLRIIYSHIYKKLAGFITKGEIDMKSLLQGLFDSEGHFDKANKLVGLTNKDRYVIKIATTCLEKMGIRYSSRVDRKGRTNLEVRDLEKFKEVGFHTRRKMKGLLDMISGNFCREKDMSYMIRFRREFRDGTTALELHRRYGIPHPTIRMVLRNLVSGNHLVTRKSGRHYVYNTVPRGCLTKPEAAPEKSSPFLKLTGNCRHEEEGLLD
ncbi:MAG: hypothetical protein JXC85_00955 [Candidatus Aenigmarchaeota archaeon]|nr:hypothetical protein [Candidatus Aenigmarchaeota archaeon]